MTYNIPDQRRGDTWDGINKISITQNGIPVNLTNSFIKMDFRRNIDTPVIMTFSTENSGITITSVSSIRVMPKVIEVPFAKYYYDLQVTFPTGIIKTYVSGTWNITPDITE
jgi:hypothetical protein